MGVAGCWVEPRSRLLSRWCRKKKDGKIVFFEEVVQTNEEVER